MRLGAVTNLADVFVIRPIIRPELFSQQFNCPGANNRSSLPLPTTIGKSVKVVPIVSLIINEPLGWLCNRTCQMPELSLSQVGNLHMNKYGEYFAVFIGKTCK